MPSEELVLTIEFNDFVTRLDLDEVLSSLDTIVEEELFYPIYREFSQPFGPHPRPPWQPSESGLSYLGITSVDSGSITLTLLLSGAVTTYVVRRFGKGVQKSILADEIERSGLLTGTLVGRVIGNARQRLNPSAREN